MRVEGVRPERAAAARPGRKTAAGFEGLLTPGIEAPATAATAAAASVSAIALAEAEAPAVADATARQHGGAVLEALGALQLSLLAPGPDRPAADARAQLADLAARLPQPADPALGAIMREIGVRAAVELARGTMDEDVSIA